MLRQSALNVATISVGGLETLENCGDIGLEGPSGIVGTHMQKPGSPGTGDDDHLEAARGEFEYLLHEIEKETAPERLLDLARKLQEALAERRREECSERSVKG